MSLWSRIIERISAFAGGSFADLIFSTKRAPERSDGFAMAVVALGAKMAKADGRVTRDEVIAFREVFEIADEDLPHVGRFYDLARQDVAGFDLYAARIARLFDDRTEALETLLEGLFHIAQADKLLHENELEFLREVARIFGVHPSQFEAMHLRNRPGEASPFDILGIEPGASAAEARKAWHGLAARFHPDRLQGAGVPVEARRMSEIRLAEINAAYDEVRRMQDAATTS